MQVDITGYQVHYNGTMMIVDSPTTTLTFTAPSLPDGVFTDTVAITVTAINKFGVGLPSDLVATEIIGTLHCVYEAIIILVMIMKIIAGKIIVATCVYNKFKYVHG